MIERLVFWVSAALCVLILAGIGYAIYDGVTAETFELRKDEWSCTASHEETVTSFASTDGGKTMIPIIATQTVCDQWSRR